VVASFGLCLAQKNESHILTGSSTPVDGDFKFGVLLLVFARFLGGDTGKLYRNGFL
jgi:hypothetical protein